MMTTAPATASLRPLVDPAADLDNAEIERYSRHLILPGIGIVGQRRLKNAKVLVVGAGGLGSPILLYLAAAGVGTLGVVDFDVVEGSNLQRQIIHTVADVGASKTTSAAESVANINPLVTVNEHRIRLDSTNALDLLAGYDLVLDGTDNFATRYLVNDACVILGKPYVWGSIYQFQGQVSVFWAAHGPQYRDVFPQPPPPGSVPSCAEGGVLGVLCGAVGSVMATEAVKLICGIGQPLLGRLLMYDALQMSYRTIRIQPDPVGEPVLALIDYDIFCGVPDVVGTSRDAELVTPAELVGELRGSAPPVLIDVRLSSEFDVVSLRDAVLIPLAEIMTPNGISRVRSLAAAGGVVLYCKSGARSATALRELTAAGLDNIRQLDGGILAWINDVDPSLPRY